MVFTATTDANGFYQFTGLRAGTYSIFQTTEPTGQSPNEFFWKDGLNQVGSLGGTNQEFDGVAMDGIIDIIVGEGQSGVNYNFGEVEDRPD